MSSDTPIFHPTSHRHIVQIIAQTPHFVILSGKKGVGLKTATQFIATRLKSHPLIVTPDEKGNIKIDIVRSLYQQTRTKNTQHKVVIIDEADAMAVSAQNVLLKLLEEPPERTSFLLATHAPFRLLATIRSRAQHVELLPVSLAQSNDLNVLKNIDDTKRKQILFFANGLPAEITRLVEDETYFKERSTEIKNAREFLSSDNYHRLVHIYKIGSDREKATKLVQNALFITGLSLKQQPSRSLSELLQKLVDSEEKLQNDGNVKVQLLRLAI